MIIPDYPIASDFSYAVLQARRLRGDLGPCQLDSTNQRLLNVPSVLVQREAFFVDREAAVNEDTNGRQS